MESKTHLYIAILVCLAIIVGTLKLAYALPTEDAVFQAGPNTDSPDVTKIPTDMSIDEMIKTDTGIGFAVPDKLVSMDGPVKPAPPVMPTGISIEQQKYIRERRIYNLVRQGLLPASALGMRYLVDSKETRNANFDKQQQEYFIYTNSILMHDRAIKEGVPVSTYIDMVNAGGPRAKQIMNDVLNCGDHFLLYPNSNRCSKSYSWLEAERNHDAAGDTIYVLQVQLDKLKGLYYQLEAHYNAAKDSIAAWTSRALFCESKKKGKR